MINPKRYRQIDELFQAALEVEPAKRSAFVSSACGDDESLRAEVEALLSSAEQEWELIERPVPEIGALFLPERPPELSVGEKIGHYKILSLLGAGGMGQVYLAEDSRLGRKIALKLLPREFTKNELRLRRFQHEARAASSLNHPNILTIHEIGLSGDRHFIATEFIEGETLRQRMNRSQLSLREALRIASQAAQALAAADAAGIVHRDIKPENIMLRPDGYVKVLDFGLAKLTEQRSLPEASTPDRADTRSGMIMGTVRYMSPEQARGQEVDARGDVFSLGVVVYEMIAGRAPFEGETNSDLIAALLKVEPPPLAQYSADAPAELQNIVRKALCKDRDQRYQTIEDMLADISRLNEQLDLDAKLQRSAQSASKVEAATDLSQTGIQPANELSASTGPKALRAALSVKRILGKIKRHKGAAAMTAAAVVLVAAGGSWASKHYLKAGVSPLPFQQRDWVLITSFENRTGDPVFDGSVEYAVERELSNSSFVNVIPRERVLDALQLMRKPPDTKIDTAIGKEICLRDGAIRALLDGRMEKLGSTYVLSVGLIDPATSRVAATTNEEASNQEQIAPAVRRVANWVRGTLGEALASIQKSNQELARVTTPSLRALQLYSQANALMKQGADEIPEQLLRQALIEDPEFASAHILLAWSIFNQRGGNQRYSGEWSPSSERAWELSQRVSDRERFFILGSYYEQKNEIDKAILAYEELVQRYPDDYWGNNNLSVAYRQTRRFKQAIQYFVQRAKLSPNDCAAQYWAARSLDVTYQFVDALVYVDRARELVSAGCNLNPGQTAWIEEMTSDETFLRGDMETKLKETDRLAQMAEPRDQSERDTHNNEVFKRYLQLGKLKAAEELAERISPEARRGLDLAIVAFARNDKISMRKHLLAHLEHARIKNEGLVPYLTRAGLISQAQELARGWKGWKGIENVLEGEIALAQRRGGRAISFLQAGVNSLRSDSGGFFLDAGRDSLATAYEQQRDSVNFLRVLEEANQEDDLPSVVLGMKMKSRLAELYREMGRVEDAEKIEADLSRRLVYADPDLPILIKLRQATGR
jgi:serine/threonine protein kinase